MLECKMLKRNQLNPNGSPTKTLRTRRLAVSKRKRRTSNVAPSAANARGWPSNKPNTKSDEITSVISDIHRVQSRPFTKRIERLKPFTKLDFSVKWCIVFLGGEIWPTRVKKKQNHRFFLNATKDAKKRSMLRSKTFWETFGAKKLPSCNPRVPATSP